MERALCPRRDRPRRGGPVGRLLGTFADAKRRAGRLESAPVARAKPVRCCRPGRHPPGRRPGIVGAGLPGDGHQPVRHPNPLHDRARDDPSIVRPAGLPRTLGWSASRTAVVGEPSLEPLPVGAIRRSVDRRLPSGHGRGGPIRRLARADQACDRGGSSRSCDPERVGASGDGARVARVRDSLAVRRARGPLGPGLRASRTFGYSNWQRGRPSRCLEYSAIRSGSAN